MDWISDEDITLWAFPAGTKKNGGVGQRRLEWTSKYGSLAASMYDSIVVGGWARFVVLV